MFRSCMSPVKAGATLKSQRGEKRFLPIKRRVNISFYKDPALFLENGETGGLGLNPTYLVRSLCVGRVNPLVERTNAQQPLTAANRPFQRPC